MTDVLAQQLEQFMVGGSLIAALLFTRKMHLVYRDKIKQLEEDHLKNTSLLHHIEKDLVILSTKIDFLTKHKGDYHE